MVPSISGALAPPTTSTSWNRDRPSSPGSPSRRRRSRRSTRSRTRTASMSASPPSREEDCGSLSRVGWGGPGGGRAKGPQPCTPPVPKTTRWLPSFDSTGRASRSITTRSSCSRAGSPSPPLRVRDPGLRRGRDLAQLAARPRLDALVRRGPTPAGQPGLRLLARPLGTEARALRRRRPVHRITRDRAAPHRPIANRPVGARAAPRLRRVMSRDSTTTAWSLVTYRTGDDPVERVGSLDPEGVVRAAPELCEYRGLMPALEDWPEVAAILERCDHRGEESAGDTKVLAPLRYPRKILCAGANYWSHLREMGGSLDQGALEDPSFFLLPATSIVGHGGGDPIEIPTDDHANVDWEGELAVVIGRPARNVSVESARAHVARYTICNDISARGFHQRTSYPAP